MIANEMEIMVSVSLITYNHEKFIRKAIDSVLNQKVNFRFEIIIGDDCSSDGTPAILQEYQKKYPEIIQLILHPRRYKEIPGRTNNLTNLYACRGKYIAMLDGDDYWINEDKLQRQVDFLEMNPEYSMSFHNSLVFWEDDTQPQFYHHDRYPFLNEQSSFNHTEVAKYSWFMQTSSLLFRSSAFVDLPEWFRKVYSADYALHLLISQSGKVKYLEDILSARRMNTNSFSSSHKRNELKTNDMRLEDLKIFKQEFKAIRESGEINTRIARRYYLKSFLLAKEMNLSSSFFYLLKSYMLDKKFILISLESLYKKCFPKS